MKLYNLTISSKISMERYKKLYKLSLYYILFYIFFKALIKLLNLI